MSGGGGGREGWVCISLTSTGPLASNKKYIFLQLILHGELNNIIIIHEYNEYIIRFRCCQTTKTYSIPILLTKFNRQHILC